MPPKSEDGQYVVPMVLLCVMCVAAAFSSVLYAIAARADVEALSARLSSLESRGCCSPVSSNQPIKKIDDNSPRLPDNVAEGQSSHSQVQNNGIFFGEKPSESTRNPILATQDNPSDAWSMPLASEMEHLQPKRKLHSGTLPAAFLHLPNEQKRSEGSSDLGEDIKDDIIDGNYALQPQLHHDALIKDRFKRSSQNREFMNEDEIEDASRPDRRRSGGGRRRGGAREDPVVRGGHRITGSAQTLAIHFDGNTSKYSLQHRHYAGNGRLRHADGIFRDWRMKEWGGRFYRQHQFQENDGTLTIRESGIYFVYAQVYYLDDHDINGFLVLVNNSPVLQCTTMTHGGGHTKANTCFTGGLVELNVGDTILLRDVEALRYSIFESEKSFFGLFRVAHHATGPREGP